MVQSTTVMSDRKFKIFMETASQMDSKQMMKEAAKLGLSSNVDVQNMIQQKAHEEKKGATQASLYGGEEGSTQAGGRVAVGNREGQVYTEQGPQGETRLPLGPGDRPVTMGLRGEKEGYEDALDTLMREPSPYEEEAEQGYGADPLEGMMAGVLEKEEMKSNKIDVVNSPELWESLKLLPREERRIIINKLQDKEEKFYESDALNEVSKYIASRNKLRDEIAKERRIEGTKETAHRRSVGAEAAEAETGTLPTQSRLAQEQQYTQNLFSGNIEVVDETGEVVDIEPNKAMDLGYSIRRRKPSVSVSVGAGGRATGKQTTDLLKTYLKNRQTLIAEEAKIDKLLSDFEGLITTDEYAQELAQYGRDKGAVVSRSTQIKESLVETDNYIDQLNKRVGLEKPAAGKQTERERVSASLKQKGWDEAKIQRYLKSRGL